MNAPAFTFGTLCSGIEAASEAFLPLGAECAYVSEIEPYPCGVLADRHGAGKPMRLPSPDEAKDEDDRKARLARIKTINRFPRWANRLPNYGDLTQIVPEELPAVDLLVAGFPCQDFSIAGLRQSLEGARGNLTLFGVKLIHELVRLRRLRSILLEQVPDILNTKDNAFGALLGGLVGHDAPIVSPYQGGRWTNAGVADGPLGTAAWRVLDAQYAGVAQRRERLFLVGSFGDGPDPVEVLFERQGLSRHPPARRKAGEGIARPLTAGSPGGSGYRLDADTAENLVPVRPQRRTAADIAPTLQAGGNSTGGDRPPGTTVDTADSLIPVAYSIMPQNSGKDYKAREVDVAQPLMAGGPVGGNQGGDYVVQPLAFSCKDHGADAGDLSPTLRAMGHGASHPNAGGQEAVAFSLRGREGGAMPEVEDGDVSPALRSADGGSTRPFIAFDAAQITSRTNRSQPQPDAPTPPLHTFGEPTTLANDMAVRRITTREGERLQGFDDLFFGGVYCARCQPKTVPVRSAELGYGLLAFCAEAARSGVAKDVTPLSASGAKDLLSARLLLDDGSAPSAVSAPLFLKKGTWPSTGTLGLVLFSSASGAGHPSAVRLPAWLVGSALCDALLKPDREREIRLGGAASQASASAITPTPAGRQRSRQSGSATALPASAVPSDVGPTAGPTMSTTSPPSRRTSTSSSSPAIWCCYVSPAIAGFIPDATALGRSCACPVCGSPDGAWSGGFSYTLIDWPTANRKGDELAEQIAYLIGHGYDPGEAERLAQTPDGPMYKALGNSKAVPLVRMLGRRYAAALERYLVARAA